LLIDRTLYPKTSLSTHYPKASFSNSSAYLRVERPPLFRERRKRSSHRLTEMESLFLSLARVRKHLYVNKTDQEGLVGNSPLLNQVKA
jgi:hypothetical protein